MTLDEAIKELHRVTPPDEPWTGEDVAYDQDREPDNIDHAIAAILNAVIAGELRKATEVQPLVEALREIFRHCQNNGIEVATVGERVVERCEETAHRALTAWENRDA